MNRGAAAASGVLLAALAAASLNLPLQRNPLALAVPALLLFALSAVRAEAGILATLALVPVVPVLGTLVAGPAVAPSLVAVMCCGAGLLVAGRRARGAPVVPATPLGRALALAAVAAAVGGVAATLAAAPGTALPGAIASLARSLAEVRPSHAAAPLRAAGVHALALGAYLAIRRLPARRRPAALAAAIAGVAVAGTWGLVEALGGPRLWPASAYDAWAKFGRAVTTLPDHNAAGALCALFVFPAAGLVISQRGARRAAAALAAAAIGAGLLVTGSRTAWVGAAVAAAAVAVRSLRGRSGARAGAAALLGVVLLSALALALPGLTGRTVRERLGTLAPATATHALRYGRLPFWRTGVAMIAAHPLGGVGPGRVPASFASYRPPTLPVASENLHSWPLQCLAENGVAGGLLLLLPFAALVPLLVRAARAAPAPFAPLVPGLAAASLAGFVSHPWLLPETQVLFWGAAALLEGAVDEAAPASRPAPSRRIIVAALVVLGAWGVPRLALAPGSERGRFGWGGWGWEEGHGEYEWLEPGAGVWLPTGAPPRSLEVRFPAEPERSAGIRVSARADAGAWSEVRLVNGEWTSLPLAPAAAAAGPVLLELRVSRAFCPRARDGGDRRVLAVQLRTP